MLDSVRDMDSSTPPTVDASLDVLIQAVGKASDDLRAVRDTLERARVDIAAHNTSLSRTVVTRAARAVDHLRETDDALREVVKALEERG